MVQLKDYGTVDKSERWSLRPFDQPGLPEILNWIEAGF